jgi:hypothetical protein
MLYTSDRAINVILFGLEEGLERLLRRRAGSNKLALSNQLLQTSKTLIAYDIYIARNPYYEA